MRRSDIKWLVALLMFSACKPQELKMIANLGHRVRVGTADGFIYAELNPADKRIITYDSRVYSWYDKGVINSSQGGYSGKLLNGQYMAYYEASKQVKTAGNYRDGLKTGKWQVWNPNGLLKESQYWNLGLKNGNSLLYDSLGNVQQKIKFRNGKPVAKKTGPGILTRIKKLFKKSPKSTTSTKLVKK